MSDRPYGYCVHVDCDCTEFLPATAYPSHGEPYDPRLDWPERCTDGPI